MATKATFADHREVLGAREPSGDCGLVVAAASSASTGSASSGGPQTITHDRVTLVNTPADDLVL